MKTIENLKDEYLRIANWEQQFRKMLTDFLDKALEACKDGVAELDFKYKTFQEAEKDGEEFYDQFPICITILDRHGFNHDIYVTRLYKKNDLYFVGGYDSSDDEWVEDWYTDNSNDTYDNLASFLGEVLGLTEEAETEPDENTACDIREHVLIGYQLVDEDGTFPSEFGCWDAFRTKEDAEIYRQEEMFDPDEWRIIEAWDMPEVAGKYHYHEIKERTFQKGEKVWINEPDNMRFAIVAKTTSVKFGNDLVEVNEINTGDEWIQTASDNEFVYQLDEEQICPKCGQPMYSAWRTNLSAHCPACEGLNKV